MILDNYIIKEVWAETLPLAVTEKAKLFATGAVYRDTNPSFTTGGVFEHMPFTNPITVDLEEPSKDTALTPTETTQGKDLKVCVTRQRSFRFSGKVMRNAGYDYFQEKYNEIADWLAIQYEKISLGILGAIYGPGGTLYNTHTLDKPAFDVNTLFEAKRKLGDNDTELATSVYHSAIINVLYNKGLVTYTDNPTYREDILIRGQIPMVAGLPVVITDLLNTIPAQAGPPAVTEKYFTYLFGNNALYFASPHLDIETFKDPRQNAIDHYLVVTTDICFHVPGVKYALTTQEPTNAQLFTPSTWQKVTTNNKTIRAIAIITPAT